ncbi:copper amine oxidase N-terminal domain-containing protein [Paenibacillus sp. FSL W8-0194]|uniref:copper amine oxidase N-terminal domain-containing protein n=1 Tax=Paenibacillus sp. FSL W8-0194 TaxID=2921711 RepID=UPI0030D80CB4
MIKKLTAGLLAAVVTMSCLIGVVSAKENTIVQVHGKYVRGYTMIPLRAVSEALGATVTWSKETYTATITKNDTVITMPIHSHHATVNGQGQMLDAASSLDGGTMYVPLRFVAQTLGGSVSWDASTGTATASLDDRTVTISTQYGKTFPAMTAARINALVKAANESADLSAYKQVRTHFRPYFTDAFINKLLQKNGAVTRHKFVTKPVTRFYEGEGLGYIKQLESPNDTGGMFVERIIDVRYIHGAWMVEDISYLLASP